jgi:hypothetical protein
LRSAFLSIPGFKELDASKIETKIESDDSIVEDFSKEAITFAFQKPPFPTSFREGIGKGRDTTTVTLVEGHNSVPALMPSGLTLFGGSVAIDIETSVWDRYPKGPSLCQKILKQAWWSRYGVTVAKYSPEWYAQSVRFLLPGEWEALALHFEESGFEIRLSRGGRAAAALVNLIGGLDEMGVLASQSAHDLLKVLARLSRKKLAQRLVKSGIATSDAEACATSVPDGLMRETPSVCTLDDLKTKLGISGVHGFLELLGQLERRHIVRRGYYLACERCGSTSWYPMDSVRMQITCPGCDFAFPFPIEYPRGGGREVPWYYTLNTLVDAIMDQDGLPGLLSLYALTREYAAACLTSGLEVIKRGESQPRLELDFTLVVGGVLWAGECKAGAELVGDDIERAKQAIELGFKHFCFCTTVNFSEDAKNLIEGLRRETDGKVKIEVLEKDALFGGTRQRARGKLHD